jgi:superfamily I DNA/RNA helicase
MNWRSYQQAILRAMTAGAGNIIVKAVAGSGKTITLLHGLQNAPEDSIALAFNKSISHEHTKRAANTISVATIHSLCFRALRRAAGNLKVADNTRKIAKALAGEMNLPFGKRAEMITDSCAMVARAKNLGIGVLLPDEEQTWRDIAAMLDIVDTPRLVAFCPALLNATKEAAEKTFEISFDDMLWLALLHEVRMPKHDMIAVDEAQDLNAAQRAILGRLLAAGGRLIAVGDPMQAIYHFRGADAQSFALIHSDFDCKELPLTVTFRCAKAVVDFARVLVPYLEALHAAPEGEVIADVRPNWSEMIPGQDVVLCRNNAPLTKLALSLIARGIGVKISGRDFASGLKKLLSRFKSTSIAKLRGELDDWRYEETTRLLSSDREDQIGSVEDRYSGLAAVLDSLPPSATIHDLDNRLEYLFGDRDGVLELSSVHRAKGREWERVFILRPGLMPAKWAKSTEARAQEINLQYVAYTRARHGFYLMADEIERAN